MPAGFYGAYIVSGLWASWSHMYFLGFVEGDGAVSIEAAHTIRNTSVDGISWVELPDYGRTLSAITPWPRGGDEKNFTAGSGPSV